MSKNFDENETIQFYDFFYKDDIGANTTSDEINLILKILRKSKSSNKSNLLKKFSILDIGAATGRISLELAKLGASVTAIDSLPNAKRIYEKKIEKFGLKSKYIVIKFEDFKISEKFDLIIMFWNTFAQMALNKKSAQEISEKIKRLLKKNGVAIIQQDNLNTFNPEEISYDETTQVDEKTSGSVKYFTEKYDKKNRISEEIEEITLTKNDERKSFSAKIIHKWWLINELKGIFSKFFSSVKILNFYGEKIENNSKSGKIYFVLRG